MADAAQDVPSKKTRLDLPETLDLETAPLAQHSHAGIHGSLAALQIAAPSGSAAAKPAEEEAATSKQTQRQGPQGLHATADRSSSPCSGENTGRGSNDEDDLPGVTAERRHHQGHRSSYSGPLGQLLGKATLDGARNSPPPSSLPRDGCVCILQVDGVQIM